MKTANLLCGAAIVACLAGCTSITGLSGSKSELACKAPEGVTCTSVSGIYANSLEGNLPGQQRSAAAGAPVETKSGPTITKSGGSADAAVFSPRDLTTPNSGDPIRLAPLVLRVWIAPWEDMDGDLHDQHYVYTVLNRGKWLIEANRQTIRDRFKPVYPLAGKEESSDKPVPDRNPTLSSSSGGKP